MRKRRLKIRCRSRGGRRPPHPGAGELCPLLCSTCQLGACSHFKVLKSGAGSSMVCQINVLHFFRLWQGVRVRHGHLGLRGSPPTRTCPRQAHHLAWGCDVHMAVRHLSPVLCCHVRLRPVFRSPAHRQEAILVKTVTTVRFTLCPHLPLTQDLGTRAKDRRGAGHSLALHWAEAESRGPAGLRRLLVSPENGLPAILPSFLQVCPEMSEAHKVSHQSDSCYPENR